MLFRVSDFLPSQSEYPIIKEIVECFIDFGYMLTEDMLVDMHFDYTMSYIRYKVTIDSVGPSKKINQISLTIFENVYNRFIAFGAS